MSLSYTVPGKDLVVTISSLKGDRSPMAARLWAFSKDPTTVPHAWRAHPCPQETLLWKENLNSPGCSYATFLLILFDPLKNGLRFQHVRTISSPGDSGGLASSWLAFPLNGFRYVSFKVFHPVLWVAPTWSMPTRMDGQVDEGG